MLSGPALHFYISTKYHQNIPKNIRVTEQTQNLSNKTKETNSKSKKARVVHDISSRPALYFYCISSYIPKGIQVTKSGQEVLR